MLGAIFVIRMVAMSMQPIIPLFVEQLSASTSDVATVAGIVLGASGLTSALAAAYLGRLGDRLGHRRILTVSLTAAGLVYLPMAIVRDPWQLALLQGLLGVAAGGLIPSANALVAHLTPLPRRGAVFGLTAALSGLGGFVGPLLGASLATSYGFRATFIAAGVLLLGMAGLVVWSAVAANQEVEPAKRALRSRGGDDKRACRGSEDVRRQHSCNSRCRQYPSPQA
jgi:DHA1 family multidrug resistance protein-like MFS transporter